MGKQKDNTFGVSLDQLKSFEVVEPKFCRVKQTKWRVHKSNTNFFLFLSLGFNLKISEQQLDCYKAFHVKP